MFKNAEIGDKVWSLEYKWGIVSEKFLDFSETPARVKFLKVEFDNGVSVQYTYEGTRAFHCDVAQTLFWDEIKFEVPQKPFDLVSEYKKLKRIDGKKIGMQRGYIFFKGINFWDYIGESARIPNVVYFEKKGVEEFVEQLNKHDISVEDLAAVMRNVATQELAKQMVDRVFCEDK